MGLLSISTCELKYYETLDSCIILHHWTALKTGPGKGGGGEIQVILLPHFDSPSEYVK